MTKCMTSLNYAIDNKTGRSGSAREDDPAERGCRRSRTTLGSTPTTPGRSHMTASLGGRYDPWPVKRSTDWLSDKSVAYLTNNKWLRSTYTIEANYWETRSIAWPFCDSRAELLVTKYKESSGKKRWVSGATFVTYLFWRTGSTQVITWWV